MLSLFLMCTGLHLIFLTSTKFAYFLYVPDILLIINLCFNLDFALCTNKKNHNVFEQELMGWLRLYQANRKPVKVLNGLRGIVKPSRYFLNSV